MSAENVEIVRRANALFNAGEFEAGLELVHPNVVFRDLQNAPDLPEVLEGRDSLARVLAQWLDVYDEFSAEVHDYVDAGAGGLAVGGTAGLLRLRSLVMLGKEVGMAEVAMQTSDHLDRRSVDREPMILRRQLQRKARTRISHSLRAAPT